jgi:hypothetical protein
LLKDQFVGVVGPVWRERDGAALLPAAYLGFERTGTVIQQSVASIVNGLIREGRLESDGGRVRKV